MLVKLLGLIDLIGAVILLMGSSVGIPVLVFFGFIFIAKSFLGFLRSFPSWIDFISGLVILLLMVFDVSIILRLVLVILLFQKGIFSFISL